MPILTETRPEETAEKQTTDPGDELFHYVKKSSIAESAVMGNFVEALCGEKFPVTRTPKPGSPVCEECRKIYEAMSD